jgi:hypothetical protein
VSIEHDALEALLKRLKALRKALREETTANVAKKALRDEAKALGATWHRDFAPTLKHALSIESFEAYGYQFTRLIKLSAPNNSRASYTAALDAIIKPFNDEILIPAQQGSLGGSAPTVFDAFFAGLSNTDESDYLAEAVACAKHGHLRAAAVLGWSAAVDRIHRVLEHNGLDKFNAMSSQMKAATVGRYKKFDKSQNVTNLAELREVFDTVILWVIEGMGMIDTNQHTRLLSCFDMRCHGAHPGEAPITQYNMMSFFSDLDQIIFMNDKFKLPSPVSGTT